MRLRGNSLAAPFHHASANVSNSHVYAPVKNKPRRNEQSEAISKSEHAKLEQKTQPPQLTERRPYALFTSVLSVSSVADVPISWFIFIVSKLRRRRPERPL